MTPVFGLMLRLDGKPVALKVRSSPSSSSKFELTFLVKELFSVELDDVNGVASDGAMLRAEASTVAKDMLSAVLASVSSPTTLIELSIDIDD